MVSTKYSVYNPNTKKWAKKYDKYQALWLGVIWMINKDYNSKRTTDQLAHDDAVFMVNHETEEFRAICGNANIDKSLIKKAIQNNMIPKNIDCIWRTPERNPNVSDEEEREIQSSESGSGRGNVRLQKRSKKVENPKKLGKSWRHFQVGKASAF